MSRAFPILLSVDELAPAYRWRLVDGMFSVLRPPMEGCGAVAIAALVCLVRAGGWDFVVILGLSLLVLAGRIVHSRLYPRLSGAGGRRRRTPDFWAVQFLVGALATASLWSLLDVATLWTGDSRLQLFILMVQAGWLGAACTRNAASPALVLGQAVVVLVPATVCACLSHDHFLLALPPFALIQFSASLGIAWAMGQQITATMISEQQLEAANARLTELSATDGLTGIANRRAFDAALKTEWSRAAREGADLGLLVIDVDFFKPFNDNYGHPAGDDCLRLIADTTARCLRRPPDLAARFGGEEFVALLPGTSITRAAEVAERVRTAILDADLAHAASPFGRVTVSIGAASLAPHPGDDAQALIDMADRALYDAKESGRNRVRCAASYVAPWIESLRASF